VTATSPNPSTAAAAEFRFDLETALRARGAVQRGRHLRIHCPAPGHTDSHPSADVDLERGWVCRSCHAGGGLRQLAELLGVIVPLATAHPPQRRQPRIPAPPPGLDHQLWREAWLETFERGRRTRRRLEPWLPIFAIADWLRRRRQFVRAARRLASALGEDSPRAWRLLTLAARTETDAAGIEAELDELMPYVA
jgi:hypothetical protein